MKSFEWSLPTKVIFGLGQFEQASKHVRGLGKQALVVTSRSFAPGGPRHNVLSQLLDQLGRIGVECQVYSQIEANPRTQTIDQAADLARAFKPRYVLALGGGSVMDAAKAIALLCVNPGSIYDYAYKGPGKERTKFNHALPVVCIPTVAATSSETNFFSVVTHWEQKRKVTLFGQPLQPTLSIIDPQLTYSVSPRQTVDGAFDMITHVMETYLSTTEPAFFQDRLTDGFVESVVHALRQVLAHPTHEEGRSTLSWCASFALSGAFSGRTGGWPIHTLEHGLSAYQDMAHGRGLAILLPRVIDFDCQVPAVAEKMRLFNERVFGRADGLVAFMKEVGAYTTLSAEVAPGTDVTKFIEYTVEHAFDTKAILVREQQPFLDNIRPILREDAFQILNNCK